MVIAPHRTERRASDDRKLAAGALEGCGAVVEFMV